MEYKQRFTREESKSAAFMFPLMAENGEYYPTSNGHITIMNRQEANSLQLAEYIISHSECKIAKSYARQIIEELREF